MTMSNENKFQFAIDRGGTFTDIFAKCPSGKIRTEKLLSVDPKNYPDAPVRHIQIQQTISVSVLWFLDIYLLLSKYIQYAVV